MRLLLAAVLLAGAAGTARAVSIQGPVVGVVEAADGAELDDVVVRLRCSGYGIHGAHRASQSARVAKTGERFRFLWAWRGLFPAGCSIEAHHPRYVTAYQPLAGDFSEDAGTIVLGSWDAFLDAGPTEPDVSRSSPWPTQHFYQHLTGILYYYLPEFEGADRAALARYVPHLHRLFDRVLATGAYRAETRYGHASPLRQIRAIEDAVGFAGSQTALFAAVAADDPAALRAAVEAGAWIDSGEVRGSVPLANAVREGKREAVRALLEMGIDANARLGERSVSPIELAIQKRRVEVAALLLAHGAVLDRASQPPDPLAGLMRSAAWSGDAASIRAFLAAGIEPDLTQSNGVTPLMDAAKENQLAVAEILIESGADVNACASHNRNALRFARSERHADMVSLLERHGAEALAPGLCEFEPDSLLRAVWQREHAGK